MLDTGYWMLDDGRRLATADCGPLTSDFGRCTFPGHFFDSNNLQRGAGGGDAQRDERRTSIS